MRRDALVYLLLSTGAACAFPDGAAPGERNVEYEVCRSRPEGAPCPESACPTGERCSPLAPNGLRFRGAVLADDFRLTHVDETPKPMAPGGHQLIRFEATWSSMFRPRIRARIEDPSIAAVISATTTAVHVRGERPGRVNLRIEDDAGLLDRIALEIVEVAQVEVGPLTPQIGGRPPMGWLERHGFDRWSVMAGEPASLYVRVLSPTGRRLVDQALSDIRAATSTRTVVRAEGWDVVDFTAERAPASPLVIRVGRFVGGSDVPVGGAPATVELTRWGPTAPAEISATRSCFVARRADGGAVLTQDWRAQGALGVVVARVVVGPGETCVELAQPGARRGSLTVEAAGASGTFPVRLD